MHRRLDYVLPKFGAVRSTPPWEHPCRYPRSKNWRKMCLVINYSAAHFPNYLEIWQDNDLWDLGDWENLKSYFRSNPRWVSLRVRIKGNYGLLTGTSACRAVSMFHYNDTIWRDTTTCCTKDFLVTLRPQDNEKSETDPYDTHAQKF